MHRRHLLRCLALAGLGVATACGPRRRDDAATPPSVRDDEPASPFSGDEADVTPGSEAQTEADGAAGPSDETEPSGDDDPPDQDPEPESEPASEPRAARVEVLCREAVGLRPAEPTPATHQLDRLTLHHTAVALEAAALAPERLRRHQRHHQGQGWPDIAYHYAVDLAGNVYELRDPAVPGDTFTDYDTTGHLHVVCEGNFDQQEPTDELLTGLTELFAALASTHDVALSALSTHRRYVPTTACPGQHLRARVDELRSDAARLVEQRPPALDLRCGEEARRRVAAIEAA